MFYLLVLVLLIALFMNYWPLFLAALLISTVLIIISCLRKHPDNKEAEEIVNPKIGAEVNRAFYDEIKQYCNKHHMTISDLIRKSVREYMDKD